MHMRLEAPRTAAELARRCSADVNFVQKQIDKLVEIGFARSRTTDGVLGYYYPIWVPGIMEGILSNREQCDRYPDLGYCFEEYTRRRIELVAPTLSSGKLGMMFMRVMPVMSAIENNSRTASYDEISTLIENATAISVGPCSCRARASWAKAAAIWKRTCACTLNDNAINYSKTGAHRLVTKEEAYEILKRAEDNGLVHEINQTPGFEDTTAICNCCGCSCFCAAHRGVLPLQERHTLQLYRACRQGKVRRLRAVR